MQPGQRPPQPGGAAVSRLLCPAGRRLHHRAAGQPGGPAGPGRRRGAVRAVPHRAAVHGGSRVAAGSGCAPQPGAAQPAGFSGPHARPRLQRLPGGRHAVFIAACPAGTAGRSAGPGRRAGVRPGHPGGHGVRSAGAALCGHRIPRVYPPCGAFPSRQRRGCAVPVRPGAVRTGGTAAFGG